MKCKLKLCFYLCLLSTIIVLPNQQAQAKAKKEGNITWEIVDDTLHIKPVSGTKKKLKNYKSNSKKPWSKKKFKTIIIHKGVREIGTYAFENLKVERIEIHEGTKIIHEGAFRNNKKLRYLRIPSSSNYIGHEAFKGCSNSKLEFTLDFKPRTLPGFGVNVFSGIEKAKHVQINYSSPKAVISGMYTSEMNKLHQNADYSIVEKTDIDTLIFLDRGYEVYTGEPIYHSLPVTDGLYQMTEGQDYTIEYKNNVNLGTATIVLEGIGYYYGTKEVTFDIALPKHYNLLYNRRSKTSISLTWDTFSTLDGYELQQYIPSKKKYKTIKKIKGNCSSYTVKNLKPHTSYTFRIRGYKTIKGKKHYSSYSKSERIFTKK